MFSIKNNKFNCCFWIGLLVIMILRVFFFGIHYFNYLDDYNTYGVFYRRNDDILNNIVLWYGLYTFRPIAFLSDAYITQWFWPIMWVILLFYTIMHFLTVFLFSQIMKKSNISFGVFGVIIIALTPLLFEAVYWVGASTRLVPGMFFSILSVYCLMIHLDHSKGIFNSFDSNIYLILYTVFNFISTGFYEQIVVFNLVFTCLIIFFNYYRIRYKFKYIIMVPIISTIFIGLYYIILAPYGKVQSRGQIATNIFYQLKHVTLYIGNLLIRVNYDITKNGFFSGIHLIKTIPQIIILILVITYTLIVFIGLIKDKINITIESDYNDILILIFGIILSVVPFMPFYILKQSFMYPRAVYPSIFGIAIVLDSILNIILTRQRKHILNTGLRSIISVIFIIPFFIVTVAQVNDFKQIEITDNKIMSNFLTEFKKSGYSEKDNVILLNTKYLYSKTYNNRLENVTSSDWAMLGKVNSDTRDFYFKKIQPVRDGEKVNFSENNRNVLFGINDNLEIFPLENNGGTLINKYDKKVFGFLKSENIKNEFLFNLK